MIQHATYLFDPTPYSTPNNPRRKRPRDPAIAAALARLRAALADIPPEEQRRRKARADALGTRTKRWR